MSRHQFAATDGPGKPSTWTTSSKNGAGRALHGNTDVIFTLSRGYITEVYYPREDVACIKEIFLVLTDGNDFYAEEGTHMQQETQWVGNGIPMFIIHNRCAEVACTIQKRIITDPLRNSLLQEVKVETGTLPRKSLKLFIIVSPRINNQGNDNNGGIMSYRGRQMLSGWKQDLCFAVACSSGWLQLSAGYCGAASDGLTQLRKHRQLTDTFGQATMGNIILAGEIDLSELNEFTIAMGFGRNATEAGNRAWASLLDGFSAAEARYIAQWKTFQKQLRRDFGKTGKLSRESGAVLRMSESQSFPGGIIASLSVPWGSSKGDKDLSGYHVVWPRDLVESSGGFLAMKSSEDALRIANYLMSTQLEEGKWWQNMWLAGDPYWTGVQLDQVALPMLLIEKCRSLKIIDKAKLDRYWPLIKQSIRFLISNGPATAEDRWEEQSGLTAFTLAAGVAGLLAAATLADLQNDKPLADYCRETADYWNSQIENWIYVTGTELAKETGTEGYYLRINPYSEPADTARNKPILLKNHLPGEDSFTVGEIISVDALALVRFGLRAPDDPRIINTLKVIDAKLKVDTPFGPCWRRYNHDGYGEHEDGNPYDGTGIGRAWPLLTGERAHYEVAAGNYNEARKLLKAMEGFSENGFLPEQIWDSAPIPDRHLEKGRPSGSAMPLVWAHAEYIKLCYSIRKKKVFDMATYVYQRYVTEKQGSAFIVWRFNFPCNSVTPPQKLRIEVMAAAELQWTANGWQDKTQVAMKNTGLGIFIADISLTDLPCEKIEFTFYWTESGNWEHRNFTVQVTK